jgi:hypothetical protein
LAVRERQSSHQGTDRHPKRTLRSRALLDIAGALHFAFGRRLRGCERRVDGR